MAKHTQTAINPGDDPAITWHGHFSLGQREAMLREAAYYRYIQRGYADGHDMEDWLVAEAELDHGTSELQPAEPAEYPLEADAQQSSVRGPWADEKMKKAIKHQP